MTNIDAALLALSSSFGGWIVVKVTVTTALALIVTRIVRRSRSAVRHALLAAAFGVALALPVASLLVPPVSLPLPSLAQVPVAPSLLMEPVEAAPPRAPVTAITSVVSAVPGSGWLSFSGLLLIGWLAGVLLFLLPIVIGLWEVRSLRRSALPWRTEQPLLERLAFDAGIRRCVEVVLQEAVPGPMTCGVVHPAIVLPPYARNWDREGLTRAIVHELEHVRRCDCMIHCFARVACAFYWFHPLMWMALRQLDLEAERSCDDAVVACSEATAYADQLVSLARRLSTFRKPPALAMVNRGDLAARIAAVLDNRRQRGRAGAIPVTLACMAAVFTVVAISPVRMVAAPPKTASASQRNVPKFEVASVRRCRSSPAGREGDAGGAGQSPGRLTTPCTLLAVLIDHAYVAFAGGRFHGRTYPVKLEGLPGWAHSDLYKIEARAEGTPGIGMMNGPMLQSLLEERFALKIHSETVEGRAYALTVARSGFKLPPFQGTCAPVEFGGTVPPEPIRDQKTCRPWELHKGSNVTWDGVMNLNSFASYLSLASGLDGPVTNQTGITGYFHFHIEYVSERRAGDPGYVPPADEAPFPSIFTAVQEQLGLKLEAAKGPRQVLVIDHVERPSAN